MTIPRLYQLTFFSLNVKVRVNNDVLRDIERSYASDDAKCTAGFVSPEVV